MKIKRKEFHLSTLLYQCKKCGKVVDLRKLQWSSDITKHMLRGTLCFECSFWEFHKDIFENHYTFIYKEVGYMFLEDFPCKSNKYYVFTDDLKMLKGSIICIGKIPKTIKVTRKPEPKFISGTAYRKRKHLFVCNARGCWDRYQCVFYNRELEKNGPWNEIPENYQVGEERCVSFLNFDSLRTFEEMIKDGDIKI